MWILMDNRSFRKVLVRGMDSLKKLQMPILWIYSSLNGHIRLHADLSAAILNIRKRILLIIVLEPEPER